MTASQATRIPAGGAFDQLPCRSLFQNEGTIESWSLFADLSIEAAPWLERTAGGRYLRETRRSGYFADQPASRISRAPLLPFAGTGGQIFRARGSNETFLPRFNALIRLADGFNAHATAAKGRRSPVVSLSAGNTPAGPQPLRRDVPAETVWNDEGGLGLQRDGLTATIAAFYQTCDNCLVTVIEGGQAVPRNAGSATNNGVEAELSFRPSRELLLFGNVARIDAGIDDKPENGIFAGDRSRLQPEWQAAAGLDARVTVAKGLELLATPTLTHRSRIFFEPPNRPGIEQGPVTPVNLRAGLADPAGRWQLTGFVTNLFDEDYLIDAGNTGGAFGIPTFIRGNPRPGGVEATVRF